MYDVWLHRRKLPEGYQGTRLRPRHPLLRVQPVLSIPARSPWPRPPQICRRECVSFTGRDQPRTPISTWCSAAILARRGRHAARRGVYALTAMFLSMWDYTRGVTEDFTRYAPDAALCESITAPGWVQPFGDTPLDNEPVGETVYMHLINRAKDYVYINTPISSSITR